MMDPFTLALIQQSVADELMQSPAPAAPAPEASPLAALAARMGGGPKGDVNVRMSGPGPRKAGERRRVGDPHPNDPTLVWDGQKWVRSTGVGTRPIHQR